MGETIPAALHPPLSLALAKAVPAIPGPNALPGGCWFEPKWDGFRAVLLVAEGAVSLLSRQSKDLTRFFPDLVAAAQQIPSGCVIDGEAVIWADDRLDFDALQRRMVTSKAALPALVRLLPASFVAFDVLAVAGHDTRALAFSDRRALLEELAREWVAPLNLSPATKDPELAKTWFEEMPPTGVEGLVVKAGAKPYEGGVRAWLKVRHRDVTDVVCAAVIGPRTRPEAIIAGLPIDGRLRIVGRSTPLAARAARELAQHLQPPAGPHPWPEQITESMLNRFTKDKSPVHLTLVEPIVVEVSADVAWSGRAYRHPLRFLRARPELDPNDVQPPHIHGGH